MSQNTFIYRVDNTDTITSISENWCSFANANAWSGTVRPENVVGHKLWEFIQDIATVHLYQQLFSRVRAGAPSHTIPFRCDSPGERRYLNLLIKALPEEQIEITSKIARTETRNPVNLLDPNTPRSSELIMVCSMCKKLKISHELWVELEEGLTRLKLFEADKMPQLSHGLCVTCYQTSMKDIKDYKESKTLPPKTS